MKFLKQVSLFLLIIFVVGLVAISCDKNSTEPSISNLYGTWNWLKTITKVTIGGVAIVDTTEYPEQGEYTTITINEDGTYSTEDLDDGVKTTETGTYTVKGDSVTISPKDEEPVTFHWEINDDILTFRFDADTTLEGITAHFFVQSDFKKVN